MAGRCQVELGFSCFILTAFACLFLPGKAPALLLSMALHEAGHLAALWYFRAAPRRVAVSALGLRIVLPEGPGLGGGRGAAISLMGPGMNLLCFLLSGAAGRAEAPFALANFSLCTLHLLPIEPLDGGLALRHLLEARLAPGQAQLISRWISAVFLVPLWVLGFLVLLRTRYNFSLLALAVYLMLYLVLKEDFS